MSFLKNKNVKMIAIFILTTFLLFILSISTSYLGFDDSLNYHFIEGIKQGLVPYLDLNIILTPLFHYIGVLFLCLFGSSPYSFYLLGSIILSTILLLFYSLLEKHVDDLDLRKLGFSIVFLIICRLLEPNYNSLFLVFAVLIICLEIKNEAKNSNLTSLLTGICLGLGFLTKQSYGTYFIISYYLYLIITMFLNKTSFKKIILVTLGGFITALLFGLYLLFNNNFNCFINLCFGGLKEFTNNTRIYLDFLSIPFGIGLTMGVLSFICYKKTKKNIFILSGLFCLVSFLFSFPLSNDYHISLSLLLQFFFFPFIVQTLSRDIKYEKAKNTLKNIYKYVFWALIIIIFVIAIKKSLRINYYELEYPYSKIGKISSLTSEKISDLIKVCEYIKEQKSLGYEVYIISANTSLYYIPLNIYTKFDLITYGNMGQNGVNNTIEELSKIDNPLFLKSELGDAVYQEPQEIEDFIVNNYVERGKIGDFRIFGK